MNSAKANKFLAMAGFPGLSVHKAEGVWYLVGHEGVTNEEAERCLHVVRMSDLSIEDLACKLKELTKDAP